jgi:hypothetical protein
MRVKAPRNFHEAAMAAKEPKGEYANAREMLDDLPAIIMHNYGEAGARTVDGLVKYKNGWRCSDPYWCTDHAAFAARWLQRHPDLPPELKAELEVIVFIAWLFEAAWRPEVWKSRQYVPRRIPNQVPV